MPNGFPAFPQGQSGFPNDLPPTLFHPASPKQKQAKPVQEVKDIDTASMASTSTFSSTVSLLKNSVRTKFPVSYKEHKARKDAAALSTVSTTEPKKSKNELPKDTMTRKSPPKKIDYEAKQRTAEAYMVMAITK